MKQAILFDIDGTLLDTWDFVFEAMKYALSFHGYPPPSDKQVREAMGRPIIEFYRVLLPKILDPSILAQTHREFQKEKFHLAKPFPKARKTLRSLKDASFLLAAISNRTRASLLRSLKLAKMANYFDLVVSAEDVVNPKPHQEHLLVALDKLGVKVQHAYMVGDTDQDILAGKNAGLKTIGATYGFLGKEVKKYNPDFVIDSIEQILKILK